MKRKTIVLFAVLAACIFLPGLIYLGLAIYYQDSFYYGTWINGIYCTGKTVEEVQKELTEGFSYKGLTVYGKEGEDFLSVEELELTFDFQPALQIYLKEQNPFDWFYQLVTGHREQVLLPIISFQEKKLEQWMYTTEFYAENKALSEDDLSITLTNEGYCLKEDKAEVLDLAKAKEKIRLALMGAIAELSLQEEDCYFYRKDTEEMVKIRELYGRIEEFQSRSFTYSVTSGELALFLKRDEETKEFLQDKEGKFILDNEAIENFVVKLAEEFDTWHNFTFTAHDGREIHLTRGNYGLQIFRKKEIDFLKEALQEENEEEILRIPEYSRDITYNDQHGIGKTYIEIDMSEQKLYYWEEGNLRLETDVVTGCVKKGMATPQMVCYVYNKKRDAVLRGEDYRSPVDYWIPVYGGIGIHDASWRSKFGGEIYIRDGSHGCINTPLEKVAELYEMIEVGIPVVIYN